MRHNDAPIFKRPNSKLIPKISEEHYYEYMRYNDEPVEETKKYHHFSRTKSYKPLSYNGYYSVTWENEDTSALIKKITFIMKASNFQDKGLIYGINIIIPRCYKQSISRHPKHIKLQPYWGGYKIQFISNLLNDNLPSSTKEFIHDLAQIFYKTMANDKEAMHQYNEDLACLYYFYTLDESKRHNYINHFFKGTHDNSGIDMPKALRGLINRY
jgi:hypothetical protein